MPLEDRWMDGFKIDVSSAITQDVIKVETK